MRPSPSQALLLGAILLLGAATSAASEIKLDSGTVLTIRSTAPSRLLPHAFYDQALASLPHVFPQHVLLAARRSGHLGEVVYALVCFRETPSSDRVLIQAVALHGDRAWTLDAIAPPSYGDTLVQVLEQIARLPSHPDAKRLP
jgi:hypothetical protein